MNIVKILMKEYGFSKYKISKLIGVSWVTVHFWSRNIYNPNLAHQQMLEVLLNETKNMAKKKNLA